MKIILPIHYTQTFKKKKSKRILVGMGWYRNAHFILSNDVKIYYHELIKNQVKGHKFKTIEPKYTIYVQRQNTDGPNVRAVIEKFFLDGLMYAKALENDNVRFISGDSSKYFVDSKNPRAEIEI